MEYIKKCAECGKEFNTNKKSAVVCSKECRRIRDNKIRAKNYHKYKGKIQARRREERANSTPNISPMWDCPHKCGKKGEYIPLCRFAENSGGMWFCDWMDIKYRETQILKASPEKGGKDCQLFEPITAESEQNKKRRVNEQRQFALPRKQARGNVRELDEEYLRVINLYNSGKMPIYECCKQLHTAHDTFRRFVRLAREEGLIGEKEPEQRVTLNDEQMEIVRRYVDGEIKLNTASKLANVHRNTIKRRAELLRKEKEKNV